MDIWLIAYSDRHLQLFGTVLSGLEVGTPHILYLLCAVLLWLLPRVLLYPILILQNSSLARNGMAQEEAWLGLGALPCQLVKHHSMGGAAFQLRSSSRLLHSWVAKLPLRTHEGGQMSPQLHHKAQLPAL